MIVMMVVAITVGDEEEETHLFPGGTSSGWLCTSWSEAARGGAAKTLKEPSDRGIVVPPRTPSPRDVLRSWTPFRG